MKKFNKTKFVEDLSEIDWNGIVSNTDDIYAVVYDWTNMFSLIFEKHAPVRNRRVSEKSCSWITREFRELTRTRDRLE